LLALAVLLEGLGGALAQDVAGGERVAEGGEGGAGGGGEAGDEAESGGREADQQAEGQRDHGERQGG
jgi:hypothetical protein